MQESASVTFEPIRPSPLEPWEILLAIVLFVCVIAAFLWKRRHRASDNHGSLDLNQK